MLELKNVGFQAEDDNKEILRDVSLKIDDKIVVITGPNGGGKSTLDRRHCTADKRTDSLGR